MASRTEPVRIQMSSTDEPDVLGHFYRRPVAPSTEPDQDDTEGHLYRRPLMPDQESGARS